MDEYWTKISEPLRGCYSVLNAKEAAIPSEKNIDNLADAILTIPKPATMSDIMAVFSVFHTHPATPEHPDPFTDYRHAYVGYRHGDGHTGTHSVEIYTEGYNFSVIRGMASISNRTDHNIVCVNYYNGVKGSERTVWPGSSDSFSVFDYSTDISGYSVLLVSGLD